MEKFDPNESIVLRPKRVFRCDQDNRTAYRQDVDKRGGKYYCRWCGGEVKDITDTVTGHDLMEIIKL